MSWHLYPLPVTQQVCQLRSMVSRYSPRACDRRSRRSFHLDGSLGATPVQGLYEGSKTAGAFAGGSAISCREGRPFLLESVPRWPQRGRGLGHCVPGCTYERATGVRGDDWDARFDSGPISRKVYAPRYSLLDIQRYTFCKTFSYLRRLGYIVTRARPPSPAYPVPATQALSQQPTTASIFRRVLAALCSPVCRLWSWFVQPWKTWWHPVVHRRWLHQNMNYREQIFFRWLIIES